MKYLVGIYLLSLFPIFILGSDNKLGALVFYEATRNKTVYEGGHIERGNAFNLNRAYFTFEAPLSPGIKYKFQTDVGRDKNGRLVAYLKNAKVDWAALGGTVTLGMQGLNVFDVQERIWGRRYLDKAPMDKYGWASAADLGIGYHAGVRKWAHFSALVTNGTGYKKPENDPYKMISLQLLFGPDNLGREKGLNLGGIFSSEPYSTQDPLTGNKIREVRKIYGLFAGLAFRGLRIGGEFARRHDPEGPECNQIVGLYGAYAWSAGGEVFARLDLLNDTAFQQQYFLVGVAWKPAAGFSIAPNARLVYLDPADAGVGGDIYFYEQADIMYEKATVYYNINFEFRL